MNLTTKQIQALRIAVAEVAGKDPWFRCSQHSEVKPEEATLGTLCPWCAETLEWWDGSNGPLPNYPESLDAVHEAMMSIDHGFSVEDKFEASLYNVCAMEGIGLGGFRDTAQVLWRATALQRCIALMMTVAPEKWKEIQNLKD